jgi:hypothetical protein
MDPFRPEYEKVYFPEEKKMSRKEEMEKINVTQLYQRETFQNGWKHKNLILFLLVVVLLLFLFYSF